MVCLSFAIVWGVKYIFLLNYIFIFQYWAHCSLLGIASTGLFLQIGIFYWTIYYISVLGSLQPAGHRLHWIISADRNILLNYILYFSTGLTAACWALPPLDYFCSSEYFTELYIIFQYWAHCSLLGIASTGLFLQIGIFYWSISLYFSTGLTAVCWASPPQDYFCRSEYFTDPSLYISVLGPLQPAGHCLHRIISPDRTSRQVLVTDLYICRV